MSFWRFLLVRLVWAVVGLLLAATVVFVITRGETREWLSHLVLPAVTLGLFFAGVYTRMVRAAIGDIRAVRDTNERRELKRRFVLVLARVAGRDFGWAVGIAVLVESLFVIPGLGRTGITSVSMPMSSS